MVLLKPSNRKNALLLTLLFISVSISAQVYPGTNLRGQVQYFISNNNRYNDLPNATIDLYYSPEPNQFLFVAQTITNNNGFYFFYSIQPGNGNFFIQVNKAKNYQIVVNQIAYNNNKFNYNQFQDLPVLYY